VIIGGFFCVRRTVKIAAFGSSYKGMCRPVGAAEGCDLLILDTWILAMHLPKQRVLVFPQPIDPPLKLQSVFAILVVIPANKASSKCWICCVSVARSKR
jgi:hypothetical protein